MALSKFTITGKNKYIGIEGYVYSPDSTNALKGYLMTQKIKPKKIIKLTSKTTKNLLEKLDLDDENLLVHFSVRYELDFKNIEKYYIET